MISLNELSINNKNSQNGRIYYYSITDYYFSNFDRMYRKFQSTIGVAIETRIYSKLNYVLRKIKYLLSTQPVPYNNIVTSEIIKSVQKSISEVIKINPEHKVLFQDLLESIKAIGSHSSSALIDCLKNKILKYSAFTYCIVTKREINLIDKEYLKNIFSDFSIKFMDEKDFKDDFSIFDYIVFIGNETFFHHSFNNSNRSKIVSFMSRDCYRNDHSENSLFIHWRAPKISTMYKDVIDETVDYTYTVGFSDFVENKDAMGKFKNKKEESILEPEISLSMVDNILQNLSEKQSNNEVQEIVKARLFELHGEKAIFIRDSRGRQDVITNRGIFKRKLSSEIVMGDYLVINSLSDSKLLEEFADKLFEKQNIAFHRKRQAKLQKLMEKLVDRYTISNLCKILKSKGLPNINESKIKNLLKTSSFKLQNNEEYFRLLLILAKNNEKVARNYYDSSRILSAFHIQAGRKIRDILRDNLEKADITKLLTSGEQEVELEDMRGVTLEIRKVLVVGNTVMEIPAVYEKRVINF
ncbi:hypothetical protein [Bacillus sp. FJAT-50079]|uniref:hypothetical protein n=1 Tax=Bacillus sp. FJAT-50079 TaxID=2833577 RepID=UPI001BCA5890|nr:hypothetical protein [Bacillus sp. FJAT-50079]MBS4208054.1 hypothetical protein [Bacillus sp. FJAT-50079]